MQFFDSHCHVHDERIPDGTDGAIETAAAAGVSAMMTVGCDRATSLAALDVARRHDAVFASVGLHPHDAASGFETVADLFGEPDVAAVGEAGLDYFYDHSDRDVQRRVFAQHIAVAHESGLPLIIHSRDAWDDTFEILATEGVPAGTIFHCFTGGPAQAERCIELGAYVSFSGIVTFPSATDVQAALAVVPDERLLIETDSPYLAPVPYRGKANRPAWVPAIAQFIADRSEVSLAHVASVTYTNAINLFDAETVAVDPIDA